MNDMVEIDADHMRAEMSRRNMSVTALAKLMPGNTSIMLLYQIRRGRQPSAPVRDALVAVLGEGILRQRTPLTDAPPAVAAQALLVKALALLAETSAPEPAVVAALERYLTKEQRGEDSKQEGVPHGAHETR